MANDFSGDSTVKALWRFENNLLDSSPGGGNDLSGGTLTYESGSPLEGSYSADFEADSSHGVWISQSDMDAGFPLKVGDTQKTITIVVRFKLESLWAIGDRAIANIWVATTKKCFWFGLSDNKISLGWGTAVGQEWDLWQQGSALSTGQEYVVGLMLDGVAKSGKIRLWNGSTTTNYSDTFLNELKVVDETLRIAHTSLGYNFDGLMDEMVIFDRCISDDEFDEIRQGIFSSTVIAKINGMLKANCLSVNGLAIGSMKTWNGLT